MTTLTQALNELGITYRQSRVGQLRDKPAEFANEMAWKLYDALGDRPFIKNEFTYSYTYNGSPFLRTREMSSAPDCHPTVVLRRIAVDAIDLFGLERCRELSWSIHFQDEGYNVVFNLS